jgi:hypothetical protein
VAMRTEVFRAGSGNSLARKTDWRRSYRGVHEPSVARKIEARRDCASTLWKPSGFAEPQNGSFGGVPWPLYGT